MNIIVNAKITRNDEIAHKIYKICLELPAEYPYPEPGQFVNIYLNDNSRLLPRPISICDWEGNTLTLVYAVVGDGTKILSTYQCGAGIRVSSPLGNGFSIEGIGRYMLISGGVGTPPMLFLAKKLMAAGCDIRAVLGFRSEPFLADEFPCTVGIATDDGSCGFKGNAIQLLMQTDIPDGTTLLSCGPRPMLRALAQFAAARGLPLQVSLEERMGCGYGACVACVCKTEGGNRKVCEDGPVFNASEVVWYE